MLDFILPEFGTMIKVMDEATKKPLLNNEWKDGAFVIKK